MIPRILLISLILARTAAADFEKWTNKDGKDAELELLLVEEKEGKITGEFATRAGKTVPLKEQDLAAESAGKLKARAVTKIRYDAGEKSESGPNDPFAATPGEAKEPTAARFRFLIAAPNLAGVKASGESVATFKVEGGAEWKSEKRKILPDPAPAMAKTPGGLRETKFALSMEGDHSAEELKRAQLKGTVQAVFGSGLKTAEAKLQLKSNKSGDMKSAKAVVGPFEVQVDQLNPFGDKDQLGVIIRDPKAGTQKEEVAADPFGGSQRPATPVPMQIARIDLIASGRKIENMNPSFLATGSAGNGEVTVILHYWSALHEKTLSFEKLPGQFEQVQ